MAMAAEAAGLVHVLIGSLAHVGVVAQLMRAVRLPDERLSAILQPFRRAQPAEIAEMCWLEHGVKIDV